MTMHQQRIKDLANKDRELDHLDRKIVDLARRLARLEAEVEVAERAAKRRGDHK